MVCGICIKVHVYMYNRIMFLLVDVSEAIHIEDIIDAILVVLYTVTNINENL